MLYVSDWAGRAVHVVDPADLRTVARIAVGEHPNQIAVHPEDDRLFVACASSNCVSVIDTRRGIVTETIHTALFPLAPEGARPTPWPSPPTARRSSSPTPTTTAWPSIDIATPARSQVKGFIPTGWYPTAVAVTPDGKTLLVGVGKGNQTKPNPINVDAAKHEDRVRPRRQAPGPAVPLHRHDALGIALDRADSRRQDARRLHRDRLQELPLLGQAADRRALPREDGDPDARSATRRRSSTSSTSSRRTGPTTRSSATSPGATATRRW